MGIFTTKLTKVQKDTEGASSFLLCAFCLLCVFCGEFLLCSEPDVAKLGKMIAHGSNRG